MPLATGEERRLEIWRAIERCAANPTLPVGVDLLCRKTGVSARTLYDICRAFSGQSPIAYIKQCRMSLAHAMLQRAGSDATVTRIAAFCGFSNPGRFAGRYQRRYGQPPSLTLRQSAPAGVGHKPSESSRTRRRRLRSVTVDVAAQPSEL